MFFYNALCAIEGGQFNRTPTTRLIQASCASLLFQTHFNIPFMLLPTSILYFEIQLFCISACLFKCCHTTSHYKIPFMPLSMFVSLYFSAFRLWTSLICLYICTSMCLYDCMWRISLLLCSSIFPDHFKIPFMLSPTWENQIPSTGVWHQSYHEFMKTV